MKRLSLVLLILPVLLSVGCTKSTQLVNDINNHSNFDFKIGTKYSSINLDDYPEFTIVQPPVECFGCNESIVSNDRLTIYGISGYPDLADELAIVRFYSTDPKYQVFNYSVGDSTDGVSKLAHDKGFEYEYSPATGEYEGRHLLYMYNRKGEKSYESGGVYISFGGDSTILSLHVGVYNTNKHGIVF